jgi:hypothetical protein
VSGLLLTRTASPVALRRAIVGAGVLLTALAVTSAATALTRAADGAWLRPPLWALAVAPLAVVLLLPSVRRAGDRLAGRLVAGDDADAYAQMASFSSRIANTLAVDDVLPRLAEAAARTVHGEQAEVQLVLDDGRRWRQVWPPDAGALESGVHVEVRHGGTAVGAIGVGAPAGLRAGDLRMLDQLARPAGLALSTVRLTFELRRRLAEVEAGNAELRASRTRIVAARRDERERLRGDVDARIAPPLRRAREALVQARTDLAAGSGDFQADLAEARTGASEALEALRRLSRGIVPPELHEIGPGAALELWASEVGLHLEVQVNAQLRELAEDAAVEAALFFCCARAAETFGGASVELGSDASEAWLRIRHTGPVDERLETLLRDRVEALGGALRLGAGGIEARLPRAPDSGRSLRPAWAREARA